MSKNHNLPDGSAAFQEVLAELHPSPQGTPPTRRKSTRTKYKSDMKPKRKFSFVQEENEEEEAEKEENERGSSRGDTKEKKKGPGRQILHGKSHCYFVEKGNVTGLADSQCHHDHRVSPSPSPSRKHLSPSPSPTRMHFSPSTSPRPNRKLTPGTQTPDTSPKLNNKFQLYKHQSSLLSVHRHHLDEFRDRAQSDTAIMARLSAARKASKSSASTATSLKTPRLQVSLADPGDPDSSSSVAGLKRSSSMRQTYENDLAESVSSSLRVSERRGLAVKTSGVPTSGDDPARTGKLSPRTVSSDHLHYLYQQFLQHGKD